ncbi:MAG: hypothetical protein ABW135_10680 [Thermoleophilaceae bacterium]
MQPRVDGVGAGVAWVELAPDRAQALVVRAPALGAWAMAGREGGRLVEEEQLRVAAGLQQRLTAPAAKSQTAGDLPPAREAPANPAAAVVQATAVSIDEAAARIRHELAQRSDTVLKRHGWGVAET